VAVEEVSFTLALVVFRLLRLALVSVQDVAAAAAVSF
jgi:hypothetical protein